MQRSHKIELNPNNKQRTYFLRACGVARFAYNWGLEMWQFYYECNKYLVDEDKVPISGYFLKEQFNSLKRSEYPFTYDVTKYASQQPFLHLDMAFKRFFSGQSSHPKFKSKGDKDSFYIGGDQIKIKDKKIAIPLLGLVRLKELPRFQGKINSVTIKPRAGKWFASIQYELQDELNIVQKTGRSVGLDFGLKHLITTSDGHVFENSKPLKQSLHKLQKAQRRLSKKLRILKDEKRSIRNSKNYQKQKAKVALIHYRVSCKREDIAHKVTTALSTNYDNIAIEDLNVSGMMKNQNLSRSVSDVSFYRLRTFLKYKTEERGKNLHIIDRFFPSSKTCSNCGDKKTDLSLKDRVFICPDCHTVLDRDFNAAINLKNKIGAVYPKFRPVEVHQLQRSVYPVLVTSISEAGRKHQIYNK